MKKFLVTFLIVLFSISAFSQHNYRQNLNHLASIDFPDTVKASTTSGFPTYKATKNANGYVVLTYDLRDSTSTIRTQEDLNKFYAGVVEGILSKTSTIKYKKNILIDGLDGLEFEYLNSSIFVYARVVYFNKNAFLYLFITNDEMQKDNQVERDKFFSSFHVIIPKINVEQFAVSSNIAYNIGNVIGKALAKFVMIGFILLIVFFIQKRFFNKSLFKFVFENLL